MKMIGKGPALGPKHISQLSPTQRAIADAQIRDALLAIVATQPRPVSMPVEDLARYAEKFILKVEFADGIVTLTAEEVSPILSA